MKFIGKAGDQGLADIGSSSLIALVQQGRGLHFMNKFSVHIKLGRKCKCLGELLLVEQMIELVCRKHVLQEHQIDMITLHS